MEETLTIRVVFDYKNKSQGKDKTFEPNSIKAYKQAVIDARNELEKYNVSTEKAASAAIQYQKAVNDLAAAEQRLSQHVQATNKTMGSGSYVLQSLNYTIRDSVYFAKDFQLGLLAVGNNLNPLIDGLLNLKVAATSAGISFKTAFMGLFTGVQGWVFGFTMLVSILQAVVFAMNTASNKAEKQKGIYDKLAEAIDALAMAYDRAKYSKEKFDEVLYKDARKSYDAYLEAVKKQQAWVDYQMAESEGSISNKIRKRPKRPEPMTEQENLLLRTWKPREEQLTKILDLYMAKDKKSREGYIKFLQRTTDISDETRGIYAQVFADFASKWSETNKSVLGRIVPDKQILKDLSTITKETKETEETKKLKKEKEDEYESYRKLKGAAFEYAKALHDALKAKKELFNLPFTKQDEEYILNQINIARKRQSEPFADIYPYEVPPAMGLYVDRALTQIKEAKSEKDLQFNLPPLYVPTKLEPVEPQYEKPDLEQTGKDIEWVTELSQTMGNALANAFMQGKFAVDKFLISIAAVIAQLALIGGIKALLGGGNFFTGIGEVFTGHAEGGIVAGNMDWGDKQLVRVNSGEMILNKAQQQKMFALLAGKTPVQDKQPIIIMKNLLDGQKFLIETTKSLAGSAR